MSRRNDKGKAVRGASERETDRHASIAALAFGIALFAAVWTAGGAAYAAGTVEELYRRKSLTLIIPQNVGGGYDSYGRLMARHLGQHLPGNPSVVPQNMTGAAGLKAENYLYGVAPKDGSVVGMVDQALYLDQMLGSPGI